MLWLSKQACFYFVERSWNLDQWLAAMSCNHVITFSLAVYLISLSHTCPIHSDDLNLEYSSHFGDWSGWISWFVSHLLFLPHLATFKYFSHPSFSLVFITLQSLLHHLHCISPTAPHLLWGFTAGQIACDCFALLSLEFSPIYLGLGVVQFSPRPPFCLCFSSNENWTELLWAFLTCPRSVLVLASFSLRCHFLFIIVHRSCCLHIGFGLNLLDQMVCFSCIPNHVACLCQLSNLSWTSFFPCYCALQVLRIEDVATTCNPFKLPTSHSSP